MQRNALVIPFLPKSQNTRPAAGNRHLAEFLSREFPIGGDSSLYGYLHLALMEHDWSYEELAAMLITIRTVIREPRVMLRFIQQAQAAFSSDAELAAESESFNWRKRPACRDLEEARQCYDSWLMVCHVPRPRRQELMFCLVMILSSIREERGSR